MQRFYAYVMSTVFLDGQRHFTVTDGGGAERSEIAEQGHVFSFKEALSYQHGFLRKSLPSNSKAYQSP